MAYLTGPVNTLSDFQCEFAGLLMGAGTAYTVPSWDFLSMFSVKTMDTQRVGADGSWSGPDYADALTSTMNFDLTATSAAAFDAAALAIEAVTAPQTSALAFWYKLPLRAARGLPFRVMQRSIPVTPTWGRLAAAAALQWRCTEARGGWQSVPRSQTVSGGATGTGAHGGLVFPMFRHIGGPNGVADFGSAGAGTSVTLTNAGNSPAWPAVTVTGPCTGFSLVLDGHTVTYSGTIGTGQQVTVDWFDGTASLAPAGLPAVGVDRTPLLTARDFTAVPAGGRSSLGVIAPGATAVAQIADIWR